MEGIEDINNNNDGPAESVASRPSRRHRRLSAKARENLEDLARDIARDAIQEATKTFLRLAKELRQKDSERQKTLKQYEDKIAHLEQELKKMQENRAQPEHRSSQLAQSRHVTRTFQGQPSGNPQIASVGPNSIGQPTPARTYAAVASQPASTTAHGLHTTALPAKKLPAKDMRIFARMHEENRFRRERAYDVCGFLREKLPENARNALKGVDHVRTGLALCPSSVEGAKILLNNSEQIATLLQAHSVEQRDTWIRAYIANVPHTRHCLITDTELEITNGELEEIRLATRVRPEKVYFSKKDEIERSGTVTAWFKVEAAKQIPLRARLLGANVYINLRLSKEKKSIECHRSGGFHNARICTRKRRCMKCSSAAHTTDEHRAPCGGTEGLNGCDCPFKCPTCNGPRAAHDPACPARPKVTHGTLQRRDQAQLRAIRAEGERAWKAASSLSYLQASQEDNDCIVVNS